MKQKSEALKQAAYKLAEEIYKNASPQGGPGEASSQGGTGPDGSAGAAGGATGRPAAPRTWITASSTTRRRSRLRLQDSRKGNRGGARLHPVPRFPFSIIHSVPGFILAKRDYYEVLERGSSKDDIKKAYRRLAIQNHPQKPGDKAAEERFKEATEAYEVLGDDQKRQAYDQFGFAGVEGMGGAGSGQDFSSVFKDFEDIFGGFGGGGFSNIFDTLFGGDARSRSGERATRGANLRYDLELSFDQASSARPSKSPIQRTIPARPAMAREARTAPASAFVRPARDRARYAAAPASSRSPRPARAAAARAR